MAPFQHSHGQGWMRTLLLVEDDREQAELLSQFLQTRGYRVLTAVDGAAARAVGEPLDCVLLDLNLPDCEGLDLCAHFKALHPQAGLLMLTARREEMDRIIGLEIGADDYVVKPYSLRELEARIRAVWRRRQPASPPDAAVGAPDEAGRQSLSGRGKLVLEPEQCRVRLDQLRVELTAREMALLQFFLRAPERIFTRDQLIEAAWGGVFVTDRVVDAMVARLRRKLRKTFGAEYIFTKHGLGYGIVDHAAPSP